MVECIPGVTAACSGAAVLGSPIGHDFAVISLSDLLTPYDLIKKRIEAAAESDLCIAIYNPSSKKRSTYLAECCDICMQYQSENLICGVVENIGRDDTKMKVMTLKELRDYTVNMFTTVYIGNSNTKVINGKMVAPRGYKAKYDNY